ncbi:MAG TPA: hypothetical protein VGJ94_09220 [Syntrophorhabdaceae bacterium]|jgi:outer membrane lipoprotein-sorting protein
MSLFSRLLLLFLSLLSCSPLFGQASQDWRAILDKVERAYAPIRDYRVEVEVKNYGEGGSVEEEHFFYTFRRPKSIRLDFLSPHPGLVVIYPDKNGKVAVRGLVPFFTLRLALDNRLLRKSSGQTIDTSDVGHMIDHIRAACTNERRGPVEAWEGNEEAIIRVLALDHFRRDREILYQFTIDTRSWLPREVRETTAGGKVERIAQFRNPELNMGVPESLFRFDKEKGHGKKDETQDP